MRFTVLGHAALFVETHAGSLLVDPWLIGSAGWRSWWHYPPAAPLRPEWLAPDWVYLTHHHFDHFHYPSMRRIDRSAAVLVPRFGVDVMAGEVRGLGFAKTSELDHAKPRELAPGLRVASFQYGFDDTAFVIDDGAQVLVDLNDAKLSAPLLRQIRRDFGRPTFMLRGHSWAQAYPHCYEAEDAADLQLVARDTFVRDFIDAARELGPRYAIPFASMVGFLHPESFHMNQHLVTPAEVADGFARAEGPGDCEVVTMVPGDCWDERGGFERSEGDWYTARDAHLARLAAEARPRIERSLAEEARRELRFEDFEAYFTRFCRALPPLLPRLLLRRPVVFEVPDASLPFWVVDFRARRVRREATAPEGRANLVRIAPGLLADAIEKQIVHIVHGTMRIRIHLQRGGVEEDFLLWGLLAIWELGYLPIARVLRARALGVAWRRRRELLGWLPLLSGGGSFLRRVSKRFAHPAEAEVSAPGETPTRDSR